MREIPQLVLVTQRRSARLSLPDLARRALIGGVDIVQLRERDLPIEEVRALVVSLLDVGVDPAQLQVNGFPDIAVEFGIGIHLPESHPVILPGNRTLSLLSRSVHTPESAVRSSGFDFVIAGHIYETASKPDLPPLGLEGLSRIVDASPCPVLAIGGITPARVPDVQRAGAHGIAVLSGINDHPKPEEAARTYRAALEAYR